MSVTDFDWWSLNAARAGNLEVNCWRPSSNTSFAALRPGEMFLFKLHSPQNFIAGGGFFSKFLVLPVSIAWEAFGLSNGVTSLPDVLDRIKLYRRGLAIAPDPKIGCIVLNEPFFFPRDQWIPAPADFSLKIVSGKTYDSEQGAGTSLWNSVQERLKQVRENEIDPGPALTAAADAPRFGPPQLVLPRLGQGSFRVMVTDAYEKRCAVTGERTLPVLDAAHIRPYASGGAHDIDNGILLRTDLHALFDRGYVGIDPKRLELLVSPRIRDEFENGRHYYALAGTKLSLPADPHYRPNAAHLAYHAESVYR